MRRLPLRLLAATAVPLALFAPVRAPRAQTPVPPSAQAAGAERDAVRRAVLDYVEGFYEGDTAKLVRSVRPDVAKSGFWRQKDSTNYVFETMPWAEFLTYANRVKARGRPAPATAPKVVTIFDVQDRTASAKLTAFWGTDYLLLGKHEGRWMVTHVLWQSPPRVAAAASPAR